MSPRSKKEYTEATHKRYRNASRNKKSEPGTGRDIPLPITFPIRPLYN